MFFNFDETSSEWFSDKHLCHNLILNNLTHFLIFKVQEYNIQPFIFHDIDQAIGPYSLKKVRPCHVVTDLLTKENPRWILSRWTRTPFVIHWTVTGMKKPTMFTAFTYGHHRKHWLLETVFTSRTNSLCIWPGWFITPIIFSFNDDYMLLGIWKIIIHFGADYLWG